MLLGMSGAFLPERTADLTVEDVRRVRQLGFTGAFTRFTGDDPFELRGSSCRRVRELFEAEGVAMFQATSYRPTLVHPNEPERRRAVRTLQEALRVAGELGARSIDTGPGSMSPRGAWFPHPYNYTPRAREQLVRSLRESVTTAEAHNVLICLEGHQLVTLRSAEVTRAVVDDVDSPWVRVDLDPVNWITLETVYNSGAAIAGMLEVLGDRVANAHLKDVVVEDRLVVHLQDCAPGTGLLDAGALLEGVERLDPNMPLILESTPTGDLGRAAAFVDATARASGIAIRDEG